MAQSGKQTLLQRLEGKDPFSSDSGVVDDDYDYDYDCQSQRSEIIVPYLPPPSPDDNDSHRVWDRIQLQVNVSRSVPGASRNSDSNSDSHSHSNSKAVDFAVVLINPRHNPVRLREYLDETIRALLHLQGHRNVEEEQEQEEQEQENGAEEINGDTAAATAQRPVCLCLLLNFRDLESSSSSAGGAAAAAAAAAAGQWMQESDVQALTMEVLQDYSSSLESSRLVLQCGSTSLFNCYGLNVLHHFIYQCYLQRKRWDLEQFLADVGRAQYSTRIAPSVSYEEFLGIAPPAGGRSESQPPPTSKKGKGKKAKKERKRDGASRKSSSTKPVIRDNDDDDEEVDPRQGSEDESVETNSDSQTGRRRRQIMTNTGTGVARDAKAGADKSKGSSSGKERPSFVSTKEALEAFLASEDEDEIENPGSPPKALERDDESESENEDDDYFYDESGRRRKMEPTVEGAPEEQSEKRAKEMADSGRGRSSDESGIGGGKSGNKHPVQTAENNKAEAIPKDDDAKDGQEKKATTGRTSPMVPSEMESGSDADDESETGSKDIDNAKDARDGDRVEPASSDTQEELSADKGNPPESSTEEIEEPSEHDESAGSERCSSAAVQAEKPEVENGNHVSTVNDDKVPSEYPGDDATSTSATTPASDEKGVSQRDKGDESDESEGGVTEDSLLPASSDAGDEGDTGSGDDDLVADEIRASENDEHGSGDNALVANEIHASENDEHAHPEEPVAAKEAAVVAELNDNEERVTEESPLSTGSDANDESVSSGSDFVIDQMRADESDEHVDPEELAAKEALATVDVDESQDGITKESPLQTKSGANDESDSEGDFVIEEMRADDADEHVDDSEEVVVKGPPVTLGSVKIDDSDSDDSVFVINEIASTDETNGTDEIDEETPSSQSDNVKARDRYQEPEQGTITATSSGDDAHDDDNDRDVEKLPPSQQSALAQEGQDDISHENTSTKSSLVPDNKDKGEGESSIRNSTAKGVMKSRSRRPQTKENISDTKAVAEPSSGLSAAARAAIAAAQLDFERMVQESDHEDEAAKKPKKKKKESETPEEKAQRRQEKKDKKEKQSKSKDSTETPEEKAQRRQEKKDKKEKESKSSHDRT
jgi:hypothetical protein